MRAPEAYWGEEETVRGEMTAKSAEEETLSKEIITNYEALQKAEENLKTLRTKLQETAVALNTVQNEPRTSNCANETGTGPCRPSQTRNYLARR